MEVFEELNILKLVIHHQEVIEAYEVALREHERVIKHLCRVVNKLEDEYKRTHPTPAVQAAIEFLEATVPLGEFVRASTILEIAERHGISRASLFRARKFMGIRSVPKDRAFNSPIEWIRHQ